MEEEVHGRVQGYGWEGQAVEKPGLVMCLPTSLWIMYNRSWVIDKIHGNINVMICRLLIKVLPPPFRPAIGRLGIKSTDSFILEYIYIDI